MVTTKGISLHSFRSFLLCFSIVLLVGCGFALRGNIDIPLAAQSVQLDFGQSKNSNLLKHFKSVAKQNGLSISDSADYTISITRIDYRRISTTINSNAKVDEYTLSSDVSFEIINAQEEVIATSLEAFSERTFQYDANAAAASNSREALLIKELWQDIAQQILRQYAARLKVK